MQAASSSKALTLNRRRQQELKRDEDEVCVCLASCAGLLACSGRLSNLLACLKTTCEILIRLSSCLRPHAAGLQRCCAAASLATACAVACLKSAQARALRTCASCDPCALAVMEDRSYEDREMRGSSFF